MESTILRDMVRTCPRWLVPAVTVGSNGVTSSVAREAQFCQEVQLFSDTYEAMSETLYSTDVVSNVIGSKMGLLIV
jgi:hypothetical protein